MVYIISTPLSAIHAIIITIFAKDILMTLHKGLHDTQESMNYGNGSACTGKRAFRVEDSQRLVTTLWGGGTATQTLLSSKFRDSWCRILAMTWHTHKDRQTRLEILYFAADSICPWICSAGICMCLFSMNHYPAAAWGRQGPPAISLNMAAMITADIYLQFDW